MYLDEQYYNRYSQDALISQVNSDVDNSDKIAQHRAAQLKYNVCTGL